MTQSLSILGRQPALGIAELESLYGAEKLQPIGQQAVMIDMPPQDIAMSRLGGTQKLCKLLTYVPSTDLAGIMKYVASTLPQHFSSVPSGKIHIGLSFYGFAFNHGKINAAALGLKKNLKSGTRGVRIIPNKQPELNTAQVIHNNLTGPSGMELVFIKAGKRTALAQTVAVQDIEAYAKRDQARPKRDARVGMLPPKLAQIIVNLATGKQEVLGSRLQVLDPFCGTGVVLQEALLMGYKAYGTDLEPRMIEYSDTNLGWLAARYNLEPNTYNLSVGDATAHDWQPFDAIACETYLGRPFSAEPKSEVLAEVMQDVDTIHRKFLKNLAAQTAPGLRLCIAVPAWRTKNGFKHLKTLDSLEDLGYTRLSFVHASSQELVYYRENQVVARELITLIRK